MAEDTRTLQVTFPKQLLEELDAVVPDRRGRTPPHDLVPAQGLKHSEDRLARL